MNSLSSTSPLKNSKDPYSEYPFLPNYSRSLEKNHSFINDLTEDLREHQKELELIKKQKVEDRNYDNRFEKTQTLHKQFQSLRKQRNDNRQSLDKTERKTRGILNQKQKQFAKTTTKKVTFEEYSNLNPNKSIDDTKINVSFQNKESIPQLQLLKNNYNKLFNQNTQLRKNRIQWKQYERVRNENADLRKKSLQLNQQIIKQRNQIGITKRQLENVKNTDMKRLDLENKRLRQQISKFKQLSGKQGSYQFIKLKIDKQGLENELKQAKNVLQIKQRTGLKEDSYQSGGYRDSKQIIQLKERLASLFNSNSVLEKEIDKCRIKEKSQDSQIEMLKTQCVNLRAILNSLEADNNNLVKSFTEIKNLNENLMIQKQSVKISENLDRVRNQKKQVIKQLDEKIKQISSLKIKIKEMSDEFSAKLEKDSQMYKQKIKCLQRELNLRKGDKANVSSQFDDMIKNQMFQNQRFKDSIQERSQEVFYLHQQLKVLKSEAENAKNELEVEKVKHLVDRKNSQNSWEVEKQNMLGEQNLMKKQIQSLKNKVKNCTQDSKKKDEFIKKHLLGKVSNYENMEKYIKGVLQKYIETKQQ